MQGGLPMAMRHAEKRAMRSMLIDGNVQSQRSHSHKLSGTCTWRLSYRYLLVLTCAMR